MTANYFLQRRYDFFSYLRYTPTIQKGIQSRIGEY